MHKLQIGRFVFTFYSIKEALELKEIPLTVYVYDKYGKDLLTGLHLLQSKTHVAYVGILFKDEDIDKVLRHINIYGTYTFGLYPENHKFETYKKIYDFFMYSRLSATYISWFSSLILKPNRAGEIFVDDKQVSLPECRDCFLKMKGCRKEVIFPDVFHPDKGIPLIEELNSHCDIVRHFAMEAVKDISLFQEEDAESFRKTRESMGIQGQYWIDPFMIYG